MKRQSRRRDSTRLIRWGLFAFSLWFIVGNYVAGTIIWPGTITDPDAMYFMKQFGFIPVMVNGWHLYFHLVTGLVCLGLGIYAARNGQHARILVGALLVSAAYLAVGLLGMLVSHNVLGFIMVDSFGNWVHLAEGTTILGIAARWWLTR